MGKRDLEIVMSASNLTRQYYEHRMIIHAQAYITSDSTSVQYTMPDRVGDVNPRWGHPLHFILNCTSTEYLNINLFNTITPYGPLPYAPVCVGSLQIPLARFLLGAGEGATGWYTLWWPVYPGGFLHLSYKLGSYDNRVTNFFGPIGRFALNSALGSVLTFGLHELFDDNN